MPSNLTRREFFKDMGLLSMGAATVAALGPIEAFGESWSDKAGIAPRPPWGIARHITEVLHVMHIQPQQVSDAVGEEQGVGILFHQAFGVAFQNTELCQPIGNGQRRSPMQGAIFGSRFYIVDAAIVGC